jgi:SAM-dependent methyltransferase
MLLEVAPIHLVRPLAAELGYEFCSLDLMSPRADVRGDLCELPMRSESVDVVVCFHVLEHIWEDRRAAAEIARVLSGDGVAIIVVPFERRNESTLEDPDTPVQDRQRLYGQSDHVRLYGRDVSDRLRSAGLAVNEVRWDELFGDDEYQRLALAGDDDRFWLCSRV